MIRTAMLAVLLWQMSSASANDVVADPQHELWVRRVEVAQGVKGEACAVLDAAVFAHAAGESLNDLRLFESGKAVPFALTQSGTQRGEDEVAVVKNATARGGDVVFDLEMPPGPYTAVTLGIAAKDFVGTAEVSAMDAGKRVELGTFAVFDLSSQGLGRSTVLALQEASYAELHVVLKLKGASGVGVVTGASVPPSREAQTMYTTVAETAKLVKRGGEVVAVFEVPAHVPVERVSVGVDGKFAGNFLKTVRVVARPMGSRDKGDMEEVRGAISRVSMRVNDVAIDSREMSVAAALGANLRSAAKVEVAVEDGIPLSFVKLEMREREVCFQADGTSHTLMYGDGELGAPVYDYARTFVAGKAETVLLGAEKRNPQYVARVDERGYVERHPELIWVVLLGVMGVAGSVVLRGARRRKHGR